MRGRREAALSRAMGLMTQRAVVVSASRFAPAATAGAIAALRFGRASDGVIVFAAVLAASFMLHRDRYPMHLMPLASFAVVGFVAITGVALAAATFALAGAPTSVALLIPPGVGAGLVLGIAQRL